jgi:hypothetical protein
MNYELERIWKEAVVASFKVLAQNLSGMTRKTTLVRIAGIRAGI